MTRAQSLVGTLTRQGFQNPNAAASIVEQWHSAEGGAASRSHGDPLVAHVAASADPDLALESVNRLRECRPELLTEMRANRVLAEQLALVLGGSAALGQHLFAHADHVDALAAKAVRRSAGELREELLTAVGADPGQPAPVATADSDELRLAYRRALLRIAARDLCAPEPMAVVEEIATELAHLADATIESALALARAEIGEEATSCRLAVIGLGKCGAQELNYVSDVDVLFIAEPVLGADGEPVVAIDKAIGVATRLASALTRICSAHTVAGTIWQVDAALRPEGKAGPLVRTLASHRAYYEKWAKTWEFQAMLKARPMAGDLDLGAEFVEMIAPKVWAVGDRDGFVSDTRAMRKRVVANIPAKEVDRELKLGPGGLRDVEFSVQLLELVHGRADDRLRIAATLPALRELVDRGYVGRSDGKELAEAYAFTRVVEHRIQLFRLRRTHLLPTEESDLRRIGRSLRLATPGPDVVEGWRRRARKVLSLHQRMFYSPVLETVSRIPSAEVHLTPEAATVRLGALGYGDPRAALQHIEALSQGVSRQADIQRQLLPAMLGWFAEGPNPDYGLLAFRQVSEALGRTPWYLRALRDEGMMAERLARLLSSSRYLVELVKRAPQTVQFLAHDQELAPRPREDLVREMYLVANRLADPREAIEAVRAIRRRELFRIGAGDVLGVLDLVTVTRALSECASATVEVSLATVARAVREGAAGTEGKDVPAMAVIALGRWGGHEMSYASDADAMFVMDASGDEASRAALAVVTELRSLLAKAGPEPPLVIDTDLRPEGKGGPMVRSLASYESYYQRWSSTWEAQALIRAAHGAGDTAVSERLLTVMDRLRWPADGLSHKQLTEIRRLKGRMEAERLPRGTDRKRHLKLGPGGLSDVEWTIQLIQLRHAGERPELRTTETLSALERATGAGLIGAEDAETLAAAWSMASRLRNAITLVRSRISDSLPTDTRELAAVAYLLGYGEGESSHMVENYHRVARRARAVVNRLFWEDS